MDYEFSENSLEHFNFEKSFYSCYNFSMKIASQEIRNLVVSSYLSKQASRQQLSVIFGYTVRTINRWVHESRQRGQNAAMARGHRVSVFSEAERTQLCQLIEQRPDITLSEIKEHFSKECSLPAIHKIVCKLGYVYKKNSEGKRTKSRRHNSKPAGME
jgi:transposase